MIKPPKFPKKLC